MFNNIQRVSIAGGPVSREIAGTALNVFAELVLANGADTFEIVNDSSTDNLRYSFDGATVEGTLYPMENRTVHTRGRKKIYVRGVSGGGGYRVVYW